MEHLAFDLFTRADLAYLAEAATCGLPSAPRPPTLGDDISWAELRALLAAPPAEVCALLNVPTVRAPKPEPDAPRMGLIERYESYAGEVYGMLTITGYGGEQRAASGVRYLVEALCQCGNVWRGQRYQLVSGRTTSCGCNQYANKQRMRRAHAAR